MDLRDRRVSQLGEEDTPFIVKRQIQMLSTNSACDTRYYRIIQVVLSHVPTVLPRKTAVLPWARQSLDLNRRAHTGCGRTAGAVLPRIRTVLPHGRHSPGTVSTDVKNYIRDYIR